MSSHFAQPPVSGAVDPPTASPFEWFLVGSLHFWPRICLLGFWIFSDLVGRAIDSAFLCVAGFFLLPWTTLTYAIMWSVSSNEVYGLEWVVVVFAVLLDLMSWGGLRQLTR